MGHGRALQQGTAAVPLDSQAYDVWVRRLTIQPHTGWAWSSSPTASRGRPVMALCAVLTPRRIDLPARHGERGGMQCIARAVTVLICLGFLQAAEFTPTPLATLAGDNLGARWKAHWADRAALLRRLYVDGYAQHGRHGAWDADVATMTKALCSDRPMDKAIARAAQAAIRAGCDDPLVRYRLLVDGQNDWMGKMVMEQGGPESATLTPSGSAAPRTADFLDQGEALTSAGYAPQLELSALIRGLSVMRATEASDVALCERLVASTVRIIPLVAAEVGDDRAKLNDVFEDRAIVLAEALPEWALPSPLATRLGDAMTTATLGLDTWWQDTLIGGYQAYLALSSGDSSLRASAKDRLERAVASRPDLPYAASSLLWMAMHSGPADARPAEARRWFEAVIRADPVQSRAQLQYIGFLQNGANPVDALLDFGVECLAVRGPQLQGCVMNSINQIAERAQRSEQIWRDPRLWRMLDRTYPDNPKSQGDRMASAWRCGQQAEAVRLWRVNPELRASPFTLFQFGVKQEQITAACAAWAASDGPAGQPAPAPVPATKASDF